MARVQPDPGTGDIIYTPPSNIPPPDPNAPTYQPPPVIPFPDPAGGYTQHPANPRTLLDNH